LRQPLTHLRNKKRNKLIIAEQRGRRVKRQKEKARNKEGQNVIKKSSLTE